MRETVGLFIRMIAWLYDILLVGVPVAVLGISLFHVDIKALVFCIAVFWLYVTVLPIITSGFTVGKRLVGIRIVSAQERILWRTMIVRHFIMFVFYILSGGILLLISVFMVMNRCDRRSLHDCLAKTKVVFYIGREI